MTAEEIKELQEKLALAEKELAAKEAKIEELTAPVTNAVKGTFKAKFKKDGKEQTGTFKFIDGMHRIWTKNGNLVPTALVLKLANGETLSETDVTDKNNMKEFVTENFKDNGKAKELLESLVDTNVVELVK